MKKIALVTLEYPPQIGGIAQYLGSLVAASEGNIDVLVNDGQSVEGPGLVKARSLLRATRLGWLVAVYTLFGLRREGYGSILISHVLPIGTAAWLARLVGGLPYVVLLHGMDIQLAGASFVKRWIVRRVLRCASAVVVNSLSTAKALHVIDSCIQPEIITPAITPTELTETPAEARAALGLDPGLFHILTVARLVPRKGIDRIVYCVRDLPPHAHLTIVGQGPERPRLEMLIKELALTNRVQCIGTLSDEYLMRWYRSADVFCLPVRERAQDAEGFGMVFLEAALHEVPVIATRTGGIPEAVVDGQTGWLVDPDDDRTLLDTLRACLADADMRMRAGCVARKRVLRDFSWVDRWKRWRAIFERL